MTTLYEGTKRVYAQPMSRGKYNEYRGWKVPADENPADDGYLVEYVDGGRGNDSRHAGYISWSPVDVFERTYKPVLVGGMTFGQALEAIKTGQRIVRSGWNGKGMFVYLVPPASYPVQTGAAKAHFGEGAMVPYNAYMAIKNVDGTVSTWVPSVNDCLATDWGIIGDPVPESSIPPHQQRVVDEHAKLLERLRKLRAFIADSKGPFRTLDDAERHCLAHQEEVMTDLAMVLAERVAAFLPAAPEADFTLGQACDLSGGDSCEASWPTNNQPPTSQE